jgi:hypothetical protein
MNIDWSKLANLEYWLEGVAGKTSITPVIEKNSSFFWFFLYLFSAFFVVGVVMRVAQAFLHSSHPLQSKLPVWGNNFAWMGVLGLLWFLLRQLSVGFLGARFWLLIGLVWFIAVLYLIARYFINFFPLEYNYFKKNKLNLNK